jgi:hypothetical protein
MFKKVKSLLKLKLDFSKFKEDMNEMTRNESINLLESFSSKSHITFCQSMEDYMTEKRLSKRVAIVLLLNLWAGFYEDGYEI